MRLDHRAGEKAYIDYAGPKVAYIDPETGEVLQASVFVAVLGASSYIYCEAQTSQDLENWTAGHVHAFAHWGGSPEVLVVDNLKTGVARGAGPTAVLNDSYRVFARECGFEVDPCRPATGSLSVWPSTPIVWPG